MGEVDHVQPLAQQAQLCRHARQRQIDVGIVFALQPLERAPVHTLRLPAVAVQDARLPVQAFAQLVSPPCSSVVVGLTLASIGQAVALPTGEHPATVQNGHPSPTSDSRTAPPDTLPAEPAGRPVQRHGIVHRLPLATVVVVAAVAVVQNHAVGFHP